MTTPSLPLRYCLPGGLTKTEGNTTARSLDIGGIYRNCGTGFSLRQIILRYSLMVPVREAWQLCSYNVYITLVNVYVALPVFTPVAGSSYAHFMEQNGGAQYVNSEFGRYFHFCWC